MIKNNALKILSLLGAIALATSAPVQAQQRVQQAQQNATEYAASFKNTEITEFIQVVGRNLGKTIIIDPDVRGRIDVRSYDVMTADQYWQFFNNVLEVYGFAAVTMESGVVKVIRDRDATNAANPIVDGDAYNEGDVVVTRVIEVENVSVRELAPLLRQLNNQAGGGNTVSYDPSNVIILTGRAESVQRLYEIIQRVDRAGNRDVDVIKLQYASADEMVRIANSLYDKTNDSTAPDIVIPKIVADQRTNSVVVSGEPRARAKVVKLIQQLDQDLKTEGNTRVYYLKYAKAEEIVEVLQGVSETMQAEMEGQQGVQSQTQQRRTRQGAFGGNTGINISAHEASNSLVITAQPDLLSSLESVIRQLDIRRAQVHVEAIIVEVLEGDGINLGLQWFSEDGGLVQYNNGQQVPIGALGAGFYNAQPREGRTTTQIDNAGNPLTTTEPDERGDITLLAQLLGSVNGAMFGVIEDGWGAVLQAVSSTTNSNILATPSLLTLDNEEASFIVGQSVPTITGSTPGDNNENPFQTVEREDVGISLKITPQINEGNAVQLVIEQEVSSISGATGVDVIFNKRELKTVVMADDGETIVLGGLIDEDVQESVQKVPLLGDIPILGELFKSTSTTRQKRNLMIFLRPRIIRDAATANAISGRKYNYIRAEQLNRREEGVALMPSADTPVLPEWNGDLTLPPSFEQYLREKGVESPEQPEANEQNSAPEQEQQGND